MPGDIGGQGPMAIGVMWMMVGVSLPLALLRYYTRKWVTHSVALDDYIYSIGWLCLLLYVTLMTVSGYFGFGRPTTTLSDLDASRAFMWELIAQAFTVLGMGFAKTSNALFLLRLVVERWHKWFLLVIIGLHAVFCSVTVALLFTQCVPTAAIWDRGVEGDCYLRDSHITANVSIFTGAIFVAADFIFAIFPWIYIWNLKMARKDKLIIAGSLSLSVLAGICGIFRSLTMGSLASPNYTEDTVPLVLLAAAEQAITMICIGIPQLRPLYRKALRPWFKGESYRPSEYPYGSGAGGNKYATGGGYAMRGTNRSVTNKSGNRKSRVVNGIDDDYDKDSGWGSIGSGSGGGSAVGGANAYASRGHDSEEYILGDLEGQKGTAAPASRVGGPGIRVTDDVRVEIEMQTPEPVSPEVMKPHAQ